MRRLGICWLWNVQELLSSMWVVGRRKKKSFYQSKVRSEIRWSEGQMKPIDILSKNLNNFEGFDIEPCMVFKGGGKATGCNKAAFEF